MLDQIGLENDFYKALSTIYKKEKDPSKAQREFAKKLSLAVIKMLQKVQVTTTVTTTVVVATAMGPGAGTGTGTGAGKLI